jgi:hypothetical protein
MTYKNYPLDVCVKAADKLIEQGAAIYQKWSCSHCGSRQTMDVQNTFFRSGICEDCSKTSPITHCNYTAVFMGRLPVKQ